MSDLNPPPTDFLANFARAKAQRDDMKAAFHLAHQELTRVLTTIKNIYSDFTTEVVQDNITHQMPLIEYKIGSKADATTKWHICLHAIANPVRLKDEDPGLLSIGLGDLGHEPLLALVLDIKDKTTYAARLLKDRYRLDQAGEFTAFVTGLGLYCGFYGDYSKTPLTLSDNARAILNPDPLTKFGNKLKP